MPDAAIQTHGGNGLASEYGLADLWGMVRLLRIAPVSREMVLNFVAQQSLGLPKSYDAPIGVAMTSTPTPVVPDALDALTRDEPRCSCANGCSTATCRTA